MRWVLTAAGLAAVSLLAVWFYLHSVSDAAGYPAVGGGATENEIWAVVDRAVTSLEYTTAASRADLERILAQTYAGPVLTELTAALWQDRPGDNVVQVEILNRRSVEIYGTDARAEAAVHFRDWADHSEWYGTGTFTLARLKQGWRIVHFDYDWQRRAPGPVSMLT